MHWSEISAEQIYNVSKLADNPFVHNVWMITKRLTQQPCACALGQLALMLNYQPGSYSVREYETEKYIWEDSEAIFLFIEERGVKRAALYGLSDGYEESYEGLDRSRQRYWEGEDRQAYEHGFHEGKKLAAMVEKDADLMNVSLYNNNPILVNQD